ncbi:RING finger and WD repeat domain-containing protein 3 [Mortierella sp. AM989]|nr:RING finger and WD repeat domain-containing protein 3 [Mortierella sp. AM989]
MDDFNDVTDLSFVVESDEDNDDDESLHGTQNSDVSMGMNSNQANSHLQVGQLTLSQDQDFQSQDQVVTRPRITPGQASIPEPCPRNVETEESTCSICFESWTNSGSHRLVSIKCGHLFGESCIFKWIAQRSRDGTVKCPECNHPTKRKDVRRIWSKSVVVVDTAERDEAVSRAKKEQESRISCEQDLANTRMAYEMLKSEMTKLQKKHDRERTFKHKYRMELKRLKLMNPETEIAKRLSYIFCKNLTFPTVPMGSTHYMSYRQDEEMLVCSRQIKDAHGIAKISMRDFSHNLNSIIPIHAQAIRDVQCYTNDSFSNKSLVLTASMDKTLKVTSATSQQSVLTYDLKAPVWSCCWSTSNPFMVYCSVKAKQTSVLTLDLRNTRMPVASFSQPSLFGHSPIHSMAHIGPSRSQHCEGILCGNLEGALVYNFETGTQNEILSQETVQSCSQGSTSLDQPNDRDAEQDRRGLLRFQGASCSAVSFDAESRHWMASYKFLGKAFTQHIRGGLVQDVQNGNLMLNSEMKVLGGPPTPCMSRNSIFSRYDGSIHMASGSNGAAYIWSGALLSRAPTDSETSYSQISTGDGLVNRLVLQAQGQQDNHHLDPIKDIKPMIIGHDEYIAMLSDRELNIHRWSEVQPEHLRLEDNETEDSDDEIPDDRIISAVLTEAIDKGKRRRIDDGGIVQSYDIVTLD